MTIHRQPRPLLLASLLLPLCLIPWNARSLVDTGPPGPSDSRGASVESFTLELGGELEEIAGWLESDRRSYSRGLALAEAVRDRRSSFEVFTGLHDPEARRDVLADLPYGEAIERAASRYRLDPLLVAAVVEVESSFRPEVGSHKGAVGLMQLMPSTAGKTRYQLQNPQTNLEAGAKYLNYLRNRFDEDLPLTLAAYNAGPTVVSRLGDIPPYRETQEYVEKVLARYVDHHRSVWRSTGTDQELRRLIAG